MHSLCLLDHLVQIKRCTTTEMILIYPYFLFLIVERWLAYFYRVYLWFLGYFFMGRWIGLYFWEYFIRRCLFRWSSSFLLISWMFFLFMKRFFFPFRHWLSLCYLFNQCWSSIFHNINGYFLKGLSIWWGTR